MLSSDTGLTTLTSTPDESRVSELIASFSTYLKTTHVQHDPKDNRFTVQFTFWPYDYIDDDLDFDEFEYTRMCGHFKKWVETLMAQVAQESPGTEVILRESKMEFRDKPDDLVESTSFLYLPDENPIAVKVCKQTWWKTI